MYKANKGVLLLLLYHLMLQSWYQKTAQAAQPLVNTLLQYNTIQILLSTPHGGFSETITKNRNNNNEKKGTLSINIVKNYLHIKFMTLKIDLKGRKTIYI